MKALTSLRADPPHPGHIMHFIRIAKKYDKLTIVLLKSENSRFPICYCKKIIEDHLNELKQYNIELKINKTHFGKITLEELRKYDFDVYVGANLQVLKHIQNLGIETEFEDRYCFYQASEIKMPKS